jgi:hypothetical protein
VETSTLVRKGYDRNGNSLTACTMVLRTLFHYTQRFIFEVFVGVIVDREIAN